MKKLLTILMLLISFWGFAQDTKPVDPLNFKSIQTPFFFYNKADSSIWVFKSADGWTRLATYRQVKHMVDSLSAVGYTKIYVDSVFLAKRDTLGLLVTQSRLDSLLSTKLSAKVDTTLLAQAGGVATLGWDGKIPMSQLGGAFLGAVNYISSWSAVNNIPTLASASPENKGNYYIVKDSAQYLGITYTNTDWIISNGSSWEKVDNSNSVSTVFGRIGNITARVGDYNTSLVTENPLNKYFTEPRARAALSLTNSGKTSYYNSDTGVINIAIADSLTAFSYEYEIVANGETIKTLPFVLRGKTKISYNGSTLRLSNWSGMYSSILTLNIPAMASDFVSILSIGNLLPPSGFLLWKVDPYGNITPNSEGISDTFWMMDSHGNITPIGSGTNNEYWKTDIYENLTPS